MRINYLILFLILSIISCKTQYYTAVEKKPQKGEFYFPIRIKNIKGELNGRLDTFQNNWYSEHLYSLKEPILKEIKPQNIEIYRYTNLGTWSNPISYRVEKTDSTLILSKRRTDGQGGYDAGKLVENKIKLIELSDWTLLKEKLDTINFWNLKTHNETIGFDGSEWILEGYKNGKYHFVTRWTPDHYGDKKFVETCVYFENLMQK